MPPKTLLKTVPEMPPQMPPQIPPEMPPEMPPQMPLKMPLEMPLEMQMGSNPTFPLPLPFPPLPSPPLPSLIPFLPWAPTAPQPLVPGRTMARPLRLRAERLSLSFSERHARPLKHGAAAAHAHPNTSPTLPHKLARVPRTSTAACVCCLGGGDGE